jgi:hypothetical protein
VGVSFHIHVLFVDTTISAEIGANFSFFGPKIGFRVHVDWYIVSFTISHGNRESRDALDWKTFKDMLPAPKQSASKRRHLGAAALDADPLPPVPERSPYLSINANGAGLAAEHKLDDEVKLWLVRPAEFRFTATSAAPATKLKVGAHEVPGEAITPRRIAGTYGSALRISILYIGDKTDRIAIRKCLVESAADCGSKRPGCAGHEIDMNAWEKLPLLANLPTAMWKTPGESDEQGIDAPRTMKSTPGVTLHPVPPTVPNCTPQMKVAVVFADRTVYDADDEWWLPISRKTAPAPNLSKATATFESIAKVASAEVAGRRAGLLQALKRFGLEGLTDGPLSKMAADPGSDFADEPREGPPAPYAHTEGVRA